MCEDLDRAEFESSRWTTARKPHVCYACKETIRPGDRYRRMAAKYDGEFGVFHHCSRCIAIMEALYAAGAESVDIGLDCGESWEDNFGDLQESVAALAFMTPDEAQAMVPRAEPQEGGKG